MRVCMRPNFMRKRVELQASAYRMAGTCLCVHEDLN
jgi:hypothetical protein